MIEFKNQGVNFNRIDADLSEILKKDDNEENNIRIFRKMQEIFPKATTIAIPSGIL